jgi:hypothetical protein
MKRNKLKILPLNFPFNQPKEDWIDCVKKEIELYLFLIRMGIIMTGKQRRCG